MAERRMFAKTIIDSDAFLDMPQSSQLLYFYLGMKADDEGVINNPRAIMRIIGVKDDDMNVLIAKKFVIPIILNNKETIIVIKHWKINNYIQNDRFVESKYREAIEQNLALDINKSYTQKNECIQSVSKMYTQDSIGKDSIVKDSINSSGNNNTHTRTQEDLMKLVSDALDKYKIDNITDAQLLKWIEDGCKDSDRYPVEDIEKYIINWSARIERKEFTNGLYKGIKNIRNY